MNGGKGLMHGKRGLVMGVANDHSIAYGIARKLGEHGAELAFTYQGEAILKRVAPLAKELGSNLVLPCDAEDISTVDAVFVRLREEWGELDFLVHSIAYSDKNELKGLYADTSRENFIRTMVISSFSFTEAREARRGDDEERRDHADGEFRRRHPCHAELQCDGRRQGRARLVGALSRRRFRRARH